MPPLTSRDELSRRRLGVFRAIEAERVAQLNKWGTQEFHPDPLWLTILAEEFGEVARAILEDDPKQMRAELVQVAAVAVAMLEVRGLS